MVGRSHSWYQQIHPDDKQRWSVEAAQMFLSGKPLRSAYRVLARDGRIVWFHCEAKMIRRKNGRPWFIHGVGFDITELKRTEEALQEERNVVSAILHTVGALVVVLDSSGRIVRFNRACEEVSGYPFAEVKGKYFWDLCVVPEEAERFKIIVEQLRVEQSARDYETSWVARDGSQRLVAWSNRRTNRKFRCAGSSSSMRFRRLFRALLGARKEVIGQIHVCDTHFRSPNLPKS
jgi:PAS domain S-box-containing protein